MQKVEDEKQSMHMVFTNIHIIWIMLFNKNIKLIIMEYKIKCDIEKHITANNEYEAMNSFYDELTSENDCLENHTTIEEIEKDSMTKQELISKFNGFYDEDTKEK
jgi:hypothetical protein